MAGAKPSFVKGKHPLPGHDYPIMWHLGGANARVWAMRKSALLGLGLVALATAAALFYERGSTSPPANLPKVETLAAPAVPADPSATDAAPFASQERRFPPLPLASVAAPLPVPDLPTVEVQPRPIHAVPNDEPPIPKVTILDRNGRVIATREPPPPSRPLPAPATAPSNTPFGGQAQASGATTLAVGGKTVRLFGVRVAEPRDRCGLGSGDTRTCVDVARDALAQRLRRYPNVYCRPPPDQRDNLAAICIDQTGTDLGGFLVAEGYALADIGQSYEYFGSEGIARYYRRGLWRNR